MVTNLSDFGFSGINGIAIFAATDKIYAFRPNGSAVKPGSTDGLFYDPEISDLAPGQKFVDAMAIGDFQIGGAGADRPEIAGNMFGDGLYVVTIRKDLAGACCHGELLWKQEFPGPPGPGQKPTIAPSPVVAKSIPGSGSSLLPVLIVGGTTDKYVYAWQGGGAPYGNSLGQVFATPNSELFNYRGIAIGSIRTTESDDYEIVHSSRDGELYMIPLAASNPGALVSARAQWSEPNGAWLSAPAIGDVTGDGENDVVVTAFFDSFGYVYVIDEATASLSAQASSEAWLFRGETKDFAPTGPALADVDGDGDLEIFVVSGSDPPPGSATHWDNYDILHRCRLDVLDYAPAGGGTLTSVSAIDSVPWSQRVEYSAGPVGSPIIAEHDQASGQPRKLDVFVPTTGAAVFEFEVASDGTSVSAKPGWPLLLPDTPRDPVIAVLDPSEHPDVSSLVVADEDGWLHVFELPKVSSTSVSVEWGSAAYDAGNTRGRLSLNPARPAPDASARDHGPSLRVTTSVGAPGNVQFQLQLSHLTVVSLDVYDVAGRRVRSLLSRRAMEPGSVVLWDGRSDSGAASASGIYWYRFRWDTGAQSGRVVLVR